MKCQLCEQEEIKWAVVVPYNEQVQPRFIEIKEEDEYLAPYWLVCDKCKDDGAVEERRRQMFAGNEEYEVSMI